MDDENGETTAEDEVTGARRSESKTVLTYNVSQYRYRSGPNHRHSQHAQEILRSFGRVVFDYDQTKRQINEENREIDIGLLLKILRFQRRNN